MCRGAFAETELKLKREWDLSEEYFGGFLPRSYWWSRNIFVWHVRVDALVDPDIESRHIGIDAWEMSPSTPESK
jgi:hypothetical protein